MHHDVASPQRFLTMLAAFAYSMQICLDWVDAFHILQPKFVLNPKHWTVAASLWCRRPLTDSIIALTIFRLASYMIILERYLMVIVFIIQLCFEQFGRLSSCKMLLWVRAKFWQICWSHVHSLLVMDVCLLFSHHDATLMFGVVCCFPLPDLLFSVIFIPISRWNSDVGIVLLCPWARCVLIWGLS